MGKKVSIRTAPRERKAEHAHNEQMHEWVAEANQERSKRLTIDIPESLHRKARLYSLTNDTSIAKLIREFLEKTVSS